MTLHIDISRFLPSDVASKEVMALLAESVGNPTDSELEKLVATCNPADYPALWIASVFHRPIGVMRLDSQNRSNCTITHIAVDANLRGRGIGRKLIEFIRDDLDFRQVEAETDSDAIGFYQACGFKVESIQQNSYSIQRYKCTFRF
ncbi:MAG: GNAT family N-acetyltransferase [Gammaproteobacteria bacterium]|nr:GNAT family N-acetyltransferase [Gammaproteobacteria bacterium]